MFPRSLDASFTAVSWHIYLVLGPIAVAAVFAAAFAALFAALSQAVVPVCLRLPVPLLEIQLS